MESKHWCVECGEECEIVEVDEGIGPYEFWGAPGNDIQIVKVSYCCEAFYTDVDPEEYRGNDYGDDECTT